MTALCPLFIVRLFAICLFVFGCHAAAVEQHSPSLKALLQRQLTPLPPSQDPFYKPPFGYEWTAPGTILRTRNVTNVLLAQGNLPVVLQALYQILYRTNDAQGRATATVTTVLVPPNPNTTKHLAYQIAYDQADWDCSPSYAFEPFSFSNETGTVQTELVFIDAALQNGWVVSTSDYEGPQASFTAGLQAAYGVLDSIRAVLAAGSISPTANTVMLGYSGGALATGWAAELKQSYAPELKIVGASMGGLPANITSSINLINKTPNAGLFAAAFNGLANGYSNLSAAVNADLKPANASAFHRPLYECMSYLIGTGGYFSDFSGQDIFTYFKSGMQILYNPVVASVLKWGGTLGLRGTPTSIPLYIWHSYGDMIAYLPDSKALAQKYCSQGAKVEYVTYANGSHQYTGLNGAGRGFHFLDERLNGVPFTACNFTDLSTAYNPDVQSITYFPVTVAAEVTLLLALTGS